MIKVLALLVCLGSVAYARKPMPVASPTKITADKARPLIRALKLANVKATVAKSKYGRLTTTWTVKSIACVTTRDENVDALEETVCDVDAKKLTGAAAVVVEDAMIKAGFPTPYRMAKAGTSTQVRATSVTCVHQQDLGKAQEDGPFVCTYVDDTKQN